MSKIVTDKRNPGHSNPNVKGVRKFCSAIDLCSYYFSSNVFNDINVIGFI